MSLLLATGAHAGGGQEAHGGDPLAAEFVAAGWQALSQIESSSELAADISSYDMENLRKALETTRVDTVDSVLEDHLGDRVDARVLPDPLRSENSKVAELVIELNRPAMYQWLRQGAMLQRIALHEYLWVIGLNDENYRISSKLRVWSNLVSPSASDSFCTND